MGEEQEGGMGSRKTCRTYGYTVRANSHLLQHLARTHHRGMMAAAYGADILANKCRFCGYRANEGYTDTVKKGKMIAHIASVHKKVLDYDEI